jgi:hypothetical protein
MVRIKTICGLPNVDIFHGAPINDDHGFFLGGGGGGFPQMAKKLKIGKKLLLFEFFSSQLFFDLQFFELFPKSILNSSM